MDLSKICLIIIVRIFYTFSERVRPDDLVVVTRKQIQIISKGILTTILNSGLNTITAAAYDFEENYTYVSYDKNKIFRILTKNMTSKLSETIVAERDQLVNGMAFDHFSSRLYWTTNDGIYFVKVPYNKSVITLPTIQVLLKVEVEIPLDITVNVNRRYVYWVNFDPRTRSATIERIRDNGSDQKVVVRHLSDPRGIKMDGRLNTLYWINWCWKHGRNIDSIDFRDILNTDYETKDDGIRDTLLHTTEERRPSLIAIGGFDVYWIDWASDELWMMCKISSKDNVSPTLITKINLENEPIGLFVLSVSSTKSSEEEDSYNENNVSVNNAGSNNNNKSVNSAELVNEVVFRKKKSTLKSVLNTLFGNDKCPQP